MDSNTGLLVFKATALSTLPQPPHIVTKWAIPGNFFIFVFSILFVGNIKTADDWIGMRVIWYGKQPLCQLCHFTLLKNGLIGVATIAPWFRLRLPSCGPGFESQAHHLRFFQFVLKL